MEKAETAIQPANTQIRHDHVHKMFVRDGSGNKRLVEIRHDDLKRRAVAAAVAKQTLALASQHITEAGRRVVLDPQWLSVYADPSTDSRLIAPAQRGKTLYQIIKTFAQLSLGMSVGWVMPKENKVHELVHGKLDLTIKANEFYQRLQDQSSGSDGTRFKTFGKFAKLYVVTANSVDELTSFSADAMHIDERDFCNRNNLPMYPARMAFSDFKLTDEISTPTVPGNRGSIGQLVVDNIHSEFLAGDQLRYHSICPYCNKRQILDWYENVVKVEHDDSGRVMRFAVRDQDWSPGSTKDCRVCCKACKYPFDRTLPGVWIATNPGAKLRSRWVEALASPIGYTIDALITRFSSALGNPSKLQNFHNMDLGRPFAGGSMGFTEDLFERCAGEHEMLQSCDGPCTIGIDVNRPWLDVHISKWVDGVQIKVYVGKLQGDEEEVIRLIKRFRVAGGIIDAQPEARFAMSLQQKAWNEAGCVIVRCKYATNEQSNPLIVSEAGDNPKLDPPRLITVAKTWAIDTLYESMQNKQVQWFRGWRGALDGALMTEFKNPVRKLIVNDAGNERFSWEGKPDHQMHAGTYDLLAGQVLGMTTMRDYSEVLPMVTLLQHKSITINEQAAAPIGINPQNDSVFIMRG